MGQMLKGKTILVVEDEPLIAIDIENELEHLGATVIIAANCKAALAKISQTMPSAAIVDGVTGADRRTLRAALQSAGVPVLVYSGYPADGDSKWPHLNKPAREGELSAALLRTLTAQVADAQ